MFSSPDKQDRIVALLEDIRKWSKLEGVKTLKVLFDTYIYDEKKQLVYYLSDGQSSPEIAKIVKIDASTVRGYWKEWASLGLMEIHPDYKKRFRRIFSLEDVGIEPPEIQEGTPTPEETKATPEGLEVFTKDQPPGETQNG